MQAISKKRHERLKDALLQMKGLLSDGQKECSCLQQVEDYNRELETMYRNYDRLLKELSRQITAYEILYSEAKVQFLGRKLKALKKEIPTEMPAFVMLQASIRLAYGT
jgi:hypothetical protein